MSVLAYWYTNFFKQIWQNSPTYTGWQPTGGDTFKIALCPPAYVPNQDTHTSYNDIVQVTGQGYTAGGALLSGKTISIATGSLVLSANPVSWSGCVFTTRYAVIYDDSNTGSLNKQLVKWIDFGEDLQLAGGSITLTFDGEGTVTVENPSSDTTPPDLLDVIVNGPTLTISFDEMLSTSSVPATSAFAVVVDGSPATVSSVAVSGSQANLTLASAVTAAQVVTISYTQPVSNPLEDPLQNKVVSFAGISVFNATVPPPPPPPPVDVTPPVVTITSPANLATVSGTITVTATATDANGVVSTVLYLDGVSFSTDTTSPYSFGWDTSATANGAHTLVARAIDPSGNIGVSSTINVTVSNPTPPPPDTTPPSVSITTPLAGAFLAGTFTVVAAATDNVGVVSATLFVDGVSQGVDPSQPYSFSLNTTLFAAGSHTLVVTAIDAASNVGTSTSVVVTFDNTVPVLSTATINGTSLALTYNEPLNTASVPLTSAFTVTADGSSRTLSSVSVSGSQALVTLASTVLSGHVVTVSYTAGSAPIEDRAGNNAANLVNQSVTNQTAGDTTAPIITAITVNGTSLVIQYNELLVEIPPPATSDFVIRVNGTVRAVNTVLASGFTVTLTLASAVISTDTVTAAYTKGTNPIQDRASNDAANFTNLPVTNITSPAAPTDLASFASQSVPSLSMTVNTTQNVSVTMRNDGTATWTAANGYHLYSQNSAGNTRWGLSQVGVPGSVIQNGNAVFPFQITAPSSAGTYAFQWRMRHTTTEFGSQSNNVNIVVSTATSGTTYWVSLTGSNGNSGLSSLAPFRTIVFALSRMAPGDTLTVMDGLWVEDFGSAIPSGISTVSRTTIRAQNTGLVTMRSPNPDSAIVSLFGKNYVHLRGLVLDGINNSSADGITLDGNSTFNRVEDTEIKNITGNQGILLNAGCNSCEFINLNVHNIGATGFEHGGYLSADNTLVDGGSWHDNSGNGIQVTDSHGGTPDNCIVRNARFYNNNESGLRYVLGTGGLMYNNQIYRNRTGFIVLGSGHKFLNNTVANNTETGILIHPEGSNIQVKNNISFGNGPNYVNDGSGTINTTNEFVANPSFVNSGANDYKLAAGSVAANTATTLTEFDTDFDGNLRPFGSAWDKGAYERQF